MAKSKHKRISKKGLAPGTLLFTGQQKMAEVDLTLILYNEQHFEEKTIKNSIEFVESSKYFDGIVWLNIDGLHDERTI